MNYAKIKHYCIANGPGIRTALFVQGCPIHCVGCFNESTCDFNGGKPFNSNTYNEICNSLSEHTEHIAGLSILGGEPLAVQNGNRKAITDLCEAIKTKFPTKTIWLWTGYEWPAVKSLEIMNFLDVIVTGPFIESQKDYTLLYCGSRNQKVIDVKASLAANSIILYKEN